MKHLVFFLEEPSARAMLEGLLPRILPEEVSPIYIQFEGKSDLEKQLERKLRAWLKPDCLFVVLRDQDSGDCLRIKDALLEKCKRADKPHTLIRIACRSLESWYLGDLAAVEKALDLPNLSRKQVARKYREPDKLGQPEEELSKLTQGCYQKISGSRNIGPLLSVERNASLSFNAFVRGLVKLVDNK